MAARCTCTIVLRGGSYDNVPSAADVLTLLCTTVLASANEMLSVW